MFVPYLWTLIRRKMPGILIIPLTGLAAGCLLCVIHGAELKNSRELVAVYDRIDVPCTVTSLTGTQTDGLALPSWVTELFFADENPDASEAERAFSACFRDPWAKSTLRATLDGVTNISLVGITGLEADKSLRAENGCEITWLEPYGEEILKTGQFACLVPQAMWESLPEGTDGGRQLTLCVLGGGPGFQEGESRDASFTVVGTYLGGSGSVYCPWAVVRELSESISGYILSDGAGAFIRNNRELDSFWDSAAGKYFVPPDPSGTQVPWEESGPYTYYPFALFINDSTLRQTIAVLERNQYILHILSLVVLLLALAVGFMTSFLLLHRREKELALQCVLGVPKRAMFFSAMAEQLALILAGLILSLAGYAVLAKEIPPWAYLGIYMVTDGLGAAAAMGAFLRRDLTAALKGE